jgi:predicted RNase H-like nuclease (RuvC/YqgF family)
MDIIDNDSVTRSGLLVLIGGGLMKVLDYLLKFLKLKKEEKIESIEADLRVSDSMLKYSHELREDIKSLKEELRTLKEENEKLSDMVMELKNSIKDMYLHNVELRKRGEEFESHLKACRMIKVGV